MVLCWSEQGMVHRRFVWALFTREKKPDEKADSPTREVTIVGDKVVWDFRGLGRWCGWMCLSYRSNGGHPRYPRFKAAYSPSIGFCPSEEPLSLN